MKRLLIIISLMLTAVSAALAQEDAPRELPGGEAHGDTAAAYMRPIVSDPEAYPRPLHNFGDLRLRQIENTLAAPTVFAWPDADRRPRQRAVTGPGMVAFPLWRGGAIAVTGASESMPGMMNVERGALTFTQQFGRLTLTAYADAAHYGYFRGMQTAYGFGGSLSYRIDDRWGVTVFGSYSTPLHPLTAAMAGYMSVPSFGGYASYEIDDHWGINVGAQAQRSSVTNRWEAQPIVEPYYKINGKAAIKVDVGGLLYNIIKTNAENNSGHRPNPTIGPPVGGPPPVAPHPGR